MKCQIRRTVSRAIATFLFAMMGMGAGTLSWAAKDRISAARASELKTKATYSYQGNSYSSGQLAELFRFENGYLGYYFEIINIPEGGYASVIDGEKVYYSCNAREGNKYRFEDGTPSQFTCTLKGPDQNEAYGKSLLIKLKDNVASGISVFVCPKPRPDRARFENCRDAVMRSLRDEDRVYPLLFVE